MRFFVTPLVALVAVTAVYALPADEKKADNKDCSVYLECFNELSMNMSSLDSVCTTFNSDKCKKLYETVKSDKAFKNCSNVNPPELLEFYCTKDENGKNCPAVEVALGYETCAKDVSDEKKRSDCIAKMSKLEADAFSNTCKSKKCTDANIKFYEFGINEAKNNNNTLPVYNARIDDELAKLKSDQCSPQGKAQTQTQGDGKAESSDASTLTYTSTLIISTILLLSTLL